MTLHIQQMGSGSDIVMLHGWGLHGGVFTTLAEQLASQFRVSLIDLPGHGRSPPARTELDLPTMAETVAACTPAHAVWLGWSLGGMIATQVAITAPQRVAKLILVGSSPRFVSDENWPWAMAPMVLAGFAQALHDDYQGTLERFLSLQITKADREVLRRLRELLLGSPPEEQSLEAGLAILRNADLRSHFAELSCPTLAILGGRDRLVPAAVAQAMQQLLPTARIEIIKGAGHVPFLSHPQAFTDLLIDFLNNTP